MYRILHLGLAVALVIGVAGCAGGEKMAGNAAYVDYANDDLGFTAQFPSKPSETSKKEDDNGRTFTTYRIYGKNSSTGESMVTVIDGYNRLPIDPGLDKAFEEAHSAMLVKRYRSATGNADASPTIEFGRMDGNLSATTVFPWTNDSGKDMWIYYVVLMRDDGRFYELTGSRPTEGDAFAAAASFRLLPSATAQANPRPGSTEPPTPIGATEEEKNIREYGFVPRSQTIRWDEAKNHIGETVTIEGVVIQLAWAGSYDKDARTYLNMGNAYTKKSKNRFQAIVWDDDVQSGDVDDFLTYGVEGKTVQITGVVKDYKGVPEIVIRTSSQVKVASDDWRH